MNKRYYLRKVAVTQSTVKLGVLAALREIRVRKLKSSLDIFAINSITSSQKAEARKDFCFFCCVWQDSCFLLR